MSGSRRPRSGAALLAGSGRSDMFPAALSSLALRERSAALQAIPAQARQAGGRSDSTRPRLHSNGSPAQARSPVRAGKFRCRGVPKTQSAGVTGVGQRLWTKRIAAVSSGSFVTPESSCVKESQLMQNSVIETVTVDNNARGWGLQGEVE